MKYYFYIGQEHEIDDFPDFCSIKEMYNSAGYDFDVELNSECCNVFAEISFEKCIESSVLLNFYNYDLRELL